MDPELYKFMESLTKTYGDKPVTMLNLLRFNSGGKESYKQYGQAFVPVAKKRGGDAKLVGNVIHDKTNGIAGPGEEPKGSKEGEWWDEVSLVHYPSIRAFCDMLAGEDYQEVNKKYRLGVGLRDRRANRSMLISSQALKDTMLLCTTEVGLDSRRREVKL